MTRPPQHHHPIYVLWAVPRSTSTAFEWMMRMRGDLACFHEPFGEAWYQGDDARWPRLTPESPRQPGLTSAGVLRRVLEVAARRPVFLKEFPIYVMHMVDSEFLDHFVHSFLIRTPAKVYPSVHSKWPDFVEAEVGFAEQARLFDLVSERTGTAPPLIDSDDLLEDPAGIVAAYCRAMGLPFMPEALSWEPGDRSEVLWYDTDYTWHANLKNSDGLKPQPRTFGTIDQEPQWVRALHDAALPHYERLHHHRLAATNAHTS